MKHAEPKPEKRQWNPESNLAKKLAKRTEENLTPSAKAFRDLFIAEYCIDFKAVAAYRRAGGNCKGKNMYNEAYNLVREPYVAKKIQEFIDLAEEKTLINRNRILAGLVREANYNGAGAQHGARVAGWGKLANILGMDTSKKSEQSIFQMQGGVLVVPATEKLTDWAQRSLIAQTELKEAVRK